MKVELSEQDISNTLVWLNRVSLEGRESVTHAMLIQKYAAALQQQVGQDGAQPTEALEKAES